jgi:hypothetical protein
MVPVERVMERVAVDDVPHDFELLALQPGAVVRPITEPISVSWSPTVLEQGNQWTDLGVDVTGKASGINPACVLAIAYSDLAIDDKSDASTSQEEYVPSRSLIELHLEGQVDVRRPGLSNIAAPMTYSDSTLIQVRDHDSTYSIPYDAVSWNAGKTIGSLDTDLSQFLKTSHQVRVPSDYSLGFMDY